MRSTRNAFFAHRDVAYSLLIVSVCLEHVLDISSPVKATASLYVTSSGMKFAPQLAIQADTARVWANCFIFTKESDPWFACA